MNTTGFRIEYWHYDEVVLLANDVEGEDPEAILASAVCRLCAQGAGGVVALVSLATGTVVARRAF